LNEVLAGLDHCLDDFGGHYGTAQNRHSADTVDNRLQAEFVEVDAIAL
jgi:hypothetical protein